MANIKRIVLEVGGVELSLSPEDAKTLQAALNELFPVKAQKEIQYVPSPYPIYPRIGHWHWSVPCDSGITLLKSTVGSTTSGIASANLNLSGSSFKSLLGK